MTGRQEIFQQAMNQGHSAAWDQLWERAIGFYRQALDEFPNQPQALVNLGLALYESQNYQEALRIYQRAVQAAPEDPLPMDKVAQLFERLGQLDYASKASLAAAELYVKNQDINRALENWQRVIRLDPDNMAANSRLAMVYERAGEKAKAVEAYLALAAILQERGDTEKAVRSVNRALQIMPNNDQAIQALALLRDFKTLPKPARKRGGTAPLRMAQVRKLDTPAGGSTEENGLDPITQGRQTALKELAGLLFQVSEEEQDSGERRGLQAIVSGDGTNARPVDHTRIVLHLSQVVDLQTREEYSAAADELERAIEAGLNTPAAHYDLGFLYYQQGRLKSAVRHLQNALKNLAYSLGAHIMLGDIYHRMNQMQEATLEYLEALKLADSQVVTPQQADELRQLYDPLIEAHRQIDDEQYQVRLCDNVRSLLVRADWHTNLQQARAQLPTETRNGPPMPLAEILTAARSSQIVEMFGNVHRLAEQGNLRTAMEEAFFALPFAPSYLPLHTLMADLMIEQDRLHDAINKYAVIARTYIIRGETVRAIDMYRRILQIAPMDLNARNRLIEQLLSLNQVDDALQEYVELAEMYYNLADLETARKSYTEGLRLAPRSDSDRYWRVQILHRMADIDLQSLDWRQALRVYEQIRLLQPDDELARNRLVELNFRLGQEKQGLAELDDYLNYWMNNGQPDQALQFLENQAKENPKRVSVRRRLAELYRKLGQVEAAVNELDAIAESLLDSGDRTGALRAVEMILSLNPANSAAYRRLLESLRQPPRN